MSGLFQDMRFALRQLRKNPGFAATAIIVLALGLGATTGMLAIVQSVLMRPLSYRAPEELMAVSVSDQATSTSDLSYPDFQEMRRNLRSFDSLAAHSEMALAVQTPDGAQMLLVPSVTANCFDLLGVRPMLGRTFRTEDESLNVSAAIVSHEFWQHSLHARPDVIGSSLRINKDLYSIVGVMPPGFYFPLQSSGVWTALQITPENKTRYGFDTFSVLGRLRSSVTAEQARSEGEAFLRHNPVKGKPSAHVWLYPYQNLVTGDEKPALLALLGACFLLLVIAVVNVANLQIGRATRRELELVVRASLGATRLRIVRQLVVESLVLSLAGAGIGWLLGMTFVQTARRLFGTYPRFDELRLDTWTFIGCLLLTSVCGVAAALAPAWYILSRNRTLSLQQGAVGRATRPQRLSGVLVTAEVALTCILLIAAGLFLRTFRSLQRVPLGFAAHHVTTFVLWPQGGDVSMSVARRAYQQTINRLRSLHGVQAAAMVTSLPVSNFQVTLDGGISIPGQPALPGRDKPSARFLAASPGYLPAMQIPLLGGRGLLDTDTNAKQLVGVVNHTFVERHLPGVDPIGRQIILEKDPDDKEDLLPPVTIVGVYGDTVQRNEIGGLPQPEVLVPYQQLPEDGMLPHYMVAFAASFAVRNDGSLTADDIRNVVKSEAPEFAIDNLGPLADAVRSLLTTRQLAMEITSGFAWVALLLSAAGLYGVLTQLVGQRVREIGIRLSLGATRENVFSLIVGQGLWMVGSGLVLGLLGALLAGRWISGFLFGTSAHDPLTYVVAGAVVVVTGILAILLPARRAAKLEPMDALRCE
jgi:predicted permease